MNSDNMGIAATDKPALKKSSSLMDAMAPILDSTTAIVGISMVIFWIMVALFAPYVTTYDPLEQDVSSLNLGPTRGHWLGTDQLGRDIWSRIAYGARLVLLLAPISVLCSLILGGILGLLGGYFGGLIDEIIMRILDAMLAFPRILIYLLIIAATGASATNIVIAISVSGVPGIARLIRGLTLDIRTRDYVLAAKSRGESPLYIMFVEILPNARGPVMVDAMLRIGYAIFSIGTLGFLGLGLPPPTPDWGSMVQRGMEQVFTNPWAVLWPSIAISSLVVGLNLFVDGIQEYSRRY